MGVTDRVAAGPGAGSGRLTRTLTVPQATALAISIVIGSGLMVLPGLVYRASGRSAFYAWVIDALLVMPLLAVYASLGARYPTAGGIAGFVQAAFGRRLAGATELLILGTFSLGIPGIAITGGRYLTYWLGGTGMVITVGALGLLGLALLVNYPGARISGGVQQVLSFSLVVVLAAVAIAGLMATRPGGAAPPVAPVSAWTAAIVSLGSVFVAYTGWEMLSFTAEEYRNPNRIPLTVGISFLVITTIYLGIAVAIQRQLEPDDPRLTTAPIAALVSATIGAGGGAVVAVIGIVIIGANLIGSLWAASRLIFASAREGLLPPVLHRLDGPGRVPRAAVLAAVSIFALVTMLTMFGWIPFEALFKLSGQNYFILYGLGVAAFLRLAGSRRARAFGLACIGLVVATTGTFGLSLLYPAALMLVGFLLAGWRGGPPVGAAKTQQP
jgi:amino acid efflux transporter